MADNRTVYDLYRLYLKSHHLPPAGATVTITAAVIEELHPRPGSEEVKPAIVLSFKGAKRSLVLNQGNASRMADIGGDDYHAWVGLVVHLKRVPLNKKKDTIIIEPAMDKPANGKPAAAPVGQALRQAQDTAEQGDREPNGGGAGR